MAKSTKKKITRRGYIFSFFKCCFKVFKKKPEIINLNEERLIDKSIFVANHSGASGPFTFELYFPKLLTPWGAHEMTGNYKSRWNYLYHIFYQQKLHWGKFKSFVIATLFALISKMVYRGAGLIGTYPNVNIIKTIKKSMAVLDHDNPMLIFPEDSSDGYHEDLELYFPGFVSLAKIYRNRRHIDLPVYNIYYSKRLNTMVIDKPVYIGKLLDEKKSETEIAKIFCDRANELFRLHIKDKQGE